MTKNEQKVMVGKKKKEKRKRQKEFLVDGKSCAFFRANISRECLLPTDVSVLRQLLENVAQDYVNLYFSKKLFSIISLGA